MSVHDSAIRDVLPDHPVVDDLDAAMRKNPDLKDNAKQVRDLVNGILLDHATTSERSRQGRLMKRKGIAGASTDIARNLATEFRGSGYRIGHLSHAPERNKALAQMRLIVDDLGTRGEAGEGIAAADVLRE